MDVHGRPVRAILTAGTIADCTLALPLLDGLELGALLADRAYDTDKILEYAQQHNIQTVIPPKRNRKVQREYNKELYKQRHLIENVFLYLKRWRGIATRYAKNAASFLAAIHIRCFALAISNS